MFIKVGASNQWIRMDLISEVRVRNEGANDWFMEVKLTTGAGFYPLLSFVLQAEAEQAAEDLLSQLGVVNFP